MKKECQSLFAGIENRRLSICEEVDRYSTNQLMFSPAEGEWNVLQVMDHICQSERLSHAYMKRSLSKKERPGKAGFRSAFRLFLLKTAFKLPFSYKSPSIADPSGKELNYGNLKKDWESVREGLRQLIDKNDGEDLARLIYNHPVAGLMNMKQALEFMDNHLARHEVQIRNLLTHPGLPKG